MDFNKKVTSNKTRYVETEKKLIFQMKLKLLLTKVFTKDMINGYSILNEAKYFIEDRSQNFLLLKPIYSTFKMTTGVTETINCSLKI